MSRRSSDTFNPVRSSKTRLVEIRESDNARIYSHNVGFVFGSFIVSDASGTSWTATETIQQARDTTPGES